MIDAGARTLGDWLAAHARRAPESIAIAAPGRVPLSYAALVRQLDELSAALSRMGVGRTDRLALVLPQGPEAAVAVLGAASVATAIPLNPGLRGREYGALLADLSPAALLVAAGADCAARDVAAARGVALLELFPQAGAPAGFLAPGGLRGAPAEPGREGSMPAGPIGSWTRGRSEDVAVILPTSGTTARPKLVPLTNANLSASAWSMAASLALGPDDCCLDLMPLFHVHGLMALLASLAAGGAVALPPVFDADRVLEWMEELEPTWYTAAPTIHGAVVEAARRRPAGAPRGRLRLIRSSSAPLTPSVAAELERRFAVPVLEGYGMTEAANQIAINPLPPRPRKVGSVGCPVGVEVAVVDTTGMRVPPAETGEIVIRGASVTAGYANDPEATAAAFTDGWFRTGDLGHLDAEGYLYITGRAKEMINRGGEKIAPREIDEALAAHPAVAEAAAFAVPHRTLGEDVAAAVVLREGASLAERELRAFAAERLADFKVPSDVLVLDRIPRTESGKPQRAVLAQRWAIDRGPGAARPGRSEPPRTPTEARLAALWTEVLGVEPIGRLDELLALGGDSIHAVQIVARIRRTFGVEVRLGTVFESKTVAGLAEILEATPASDDQPIARAEPGRPRPASFIQERLWLLHQMDPAGSAHNMPVEMRLAGPLDVAALERSLAEVVRRHEVLRAGLDLVDGQLCQVEAPASPSILSTSDLSGLPVAEREARAAALAREAAARPFDLARGPLLRASLVRLAPQEHRLLLTLHHVVGDGWSLGILRRELAALYGAFAAGRPSPLPDPSLQYGDFSAWQRQWVRGPRLAEQLDYWRRRLTPLPVELELPTDRPRPRAPGFESGREDVVLSPDVANALRELGRLHGASLFMTLLAALQVLLSRLSGSEDVVVGAPVVSRGRPELEELVGCFLNTLVLRTDLSGDPTFREALERVREGVLGAFARQDVPFEQVVEALAPAREVDRIPLVRVFFNMQNFPDVPATFPGLSVETSEAPEIGARFDLTLYARDLPSGLRLALSYDTALFDADRAARMLGQYRRILEAIVADAGQRVSALPLLSIAERRRALAEWNDTRSAFPDVCLHDLVEAQVARTPDALAVVDGDRTLTYRELDGQADRLARWLRRRGVRPGTLVAVNVERSAEMIVGFLGVLKAGGAYVPLDPAHPAERVAFVLEETRPVAILTQERLLEGLPRALPPVLCLDRDGLLLDEDAGPLPSAARPEDLAYVAYTSGSTGRPKGVLTPHRGVVNYLTWMSRTFALGPGDAALQWVTPSFDASVRSMFGTLTVGGRVVVVPEAEVADPQAVLGRTIAHGVTRIVAIVPSMLRALVASADEDGRSAPAVRTVLVSGEPLLPADCQAARRVFARDALVVNLYGPTESTMTVTAHAASPADDGQASMPIGRPIDNARVYVLDRRGQPVPVGVPGEIHVGGAGMAWGYLGRPELSAERFVPDPFGEDRGARLYRTGDRGRYRADGTLEFLGRLDHQVKVRGNRVELGEVETVLGEHPALREAAVVSREQAPGDWRLVAFVVGAGAPPPVAQELRSFLQRRLPGYMIPAHFVSLDALPRTPNGKLDRGKLPETSSPERPGTPAAPRTAVESALVDMWTSLLGLEGIGIDESFFDVGGHSLLAARLLSRVRSHFQVDVPLRHFFEDPTVARLALAVTAALVERAPTGQVDGLLDLLAAPSEPRLERQGRPEAMGRAQPTG